MNKLVKLRVVDFLNNYKDKGFIVLKTALDIAIDPGIDHRLGDFSFKLLVLRLQSRGISYDPRNILRILERNYGLIEKSYDSRRQKWWRFVDLEETRRALYEYYSGGSLDEPRLRLLLLKYKSLEPKKLLDTLRRLSSKEILTSIDKRVFRRLVFDELERIIDILESMMEYEDIFQNEIRVLNEILEMAEIVAGKLDISTDNKYKAKDSIGDTERSKYFSRELL